MQPLTRQEMQNAMQQLTNAITSQVVTKQDLSRAITTINQQSMVQSQNDMQRIFKQYADRIVDRAYQEFKLQNTSMQQMESKIDTVAKKISEHDVKLARIDSLLNSVYEQLQEVTGVESFYDNTADDNKVTTEQERFAQRTAFGGLFG